MLPQKYQSAPNAIASYTWTDLLTGKAYKKFYGTKAESGYILVTEPLRSTEGYITTAAAANTDVMTKVIDVTFETTFDIPQIIEGLSMINATLGGVSVTDVTTKTWKMVCDIYKNTTFLASGATAILSGTTTAVATADSSEILLDITLPKTSFARGDTLKLQCEMWAKKVTGNPGTNIFAIGNDPADRNDPNAAASKVIEDADTTKLEFYVPFVPDL